MKFSIPRLDIKDQEKVIHDELALDEVKVKSLSFLNSSKALQKSLINQIF